MRCARRPESTEPHRAIAPLTAFRDLDTRVPGLANRVLDAGPAIRTHLNVFVDGERVALDASVRPGARIHVIPAVSGG